MINFLVCKPSGEIIYTGSCPDDHLVLQGKHLENVIVAVGKADWSEDYYDTVSGKVRPKGPKPSVVHAFDYTSKAWVDPRTLEDRKQALWAEIKVIRDQKEFGGFEWDSSIFDSDLVSQGRLQRNANIAAISPEFTADWTLADNTVRTLNAIQLMEISLALDAHVAAQHARSRVLREQIEAAQTADQLGGISW